jgi:Ca-activated chloride channel homolog
MQRGMKTRRPSTTTLMASLAVVLLAGAGQLAMAERVSALPRLLPSLHQPGAGGQPLAVRVVGRNGSRVVVQGVVAIPTGKAQANDHGFFNLRLTGEVLTNGRVYDRFGFHFDIPIEEGVEAPLALSFERRLRPGDFRLVIEVEDLQSGRVVRAERDLRVPRLEPSSELGVTASGGVDTDLGRRLGEASSGPAIRLLPPPNLVSGYQTFVAVVEGEGIERVTFSLDGEPVLTRNRPPFEATLNLGERPTIRTLRVEGMTPDGRVVARDELQLNGGGERFSVALLEPAAGDREGEHLWVQARVQAPAARTVERVDIYLGDEKVATWTEPPWRGRLRVPAHEPMPLRAVATLDEGAQAEDAILLNVVGHDSIQVDLVELSTAVVDHRGRPVEGLGPEDFRVLEDGIEQRVERFEKVRNAPVHLALVVDTSGSMHPIMEATRRTALTFLEKLMRPDDRAMLVTFANRPRARVPFTSEVSLLANGLALVEAGGATALYDSLVYTLEEMAGIRGQRVLVLLSDGMDNRSRYSAQDVLELARRAAVTIYTVGIEEHPGQGDLDRETLRLLAGESGGRSFFTRGDQRSMAQVYREIEAEVRSRYLLSYYASGSPDDRSFRLVVVEVSRPRAEARTIRGYYP